MLRPYLGNVLVEEVSASENIGGFTVTLDNKVKKGKVVALPRPRISPNGVAEVIDLEIGETVIFNNQGRVYETNKDGKSLVIIDITSIVGVESEE